MVGNSPTSSVVGYFSNGSISYYYGIQKFITFVPKFFDIHETVSVLGCATLQSLCDFYFPCSRRSPDM